MSNRTVLSTNKHWQELMIRNQKLAMEVTRLQEQNRFLRQRVHALAISNLHLEKKTCDKGCQTEVHESENEDPSHEISCHNLPRQDYLAERLDPPVEQATNATNPDIAYTGKSKLEVTSNRRRRSHVRRNSMSKLDFDLLEESSDFLKVEIIIPEDGEYQLNTPVRRSSRCRSTLRTEDANNSNPTTNSPFQTRVSDKLAQKVMSPYDAGSERLGVFSPMRSDSKNESLAPTTPTALDPVEPPIARTPRLVRKPLSYQEPSLRAKVRKGFKFFKFA